MDTSVRTRLNGGTVVIAAIALFALNVVVHKVVGAIGAGTVLPWQPSDIVLRALVSSIAAFGIVWVVTDAARTGSRLGSVMRALLLCTIPVIAVTSGGVSGTFEHGRVAEALMTVFLGAVIIGLITHSRMRIQRLSAR